MQNPIILFHDNIDNVWYDTKYVMYNVIFNLFT